MEEKIEIRVEKNDYKGDGKSWVARADEKGEIIEFLRCDKFEGPKNRSGYAYQGTKTYILGDGCDGYYLVNEPYTKTYSIRAFFQIKNGKVKIIWSRYANGYHRGEEAPPPRCLCKWI